MDPSQRNPADPFAWSPPTDQWDPHSHADPAGWLDPEQQRTRDRRRVQALLLGFGLLGMVLLLVAVTSVLQTAGIVLLGMRLRLFPDSWDFLESTFVSMASFLGVCLLWGRWKDRSWQGRAGLLVLMGAVDIALWAADHAATIGIADGPVGHEWFLYCVGHTLGWAELALISGLAAEVAVHLGRPRVAEAARGARTLTNVGTLAWLMIFVVTTRWRTPVWPLVQRPNIPLMELALLWRGEMLMYTVSLVQVTVLTLTACSCCAMMLRRMNEEDHAANHPARPSDAAWEDWERDRDRA